MADPGDFDIFSGQDPFAGILRANPSKPKSKGGGGVITRFPMFQGSVAGSALAGKSGLGANRVGGAVGGVPERGSVSALDQLTSALGSEKLEFEKLQAAQRARLDEQLSGIEGLIGDSDSIFGDALNESLGLMSGVDADLRAQQAAISGDFSDFALSTEQKLQEGLGSLFGNIDETTERARDASGRLADIVDGEVRGLTSQAMEFARQSIASAKAASTGFNREAHESIKAIVAGLEGRFESESRMLASGVDAQGNPIPPDVAEARLRALRSDMNESVGQTVGAISLEQNRIQADLRTRIAEAQNAAAGVALGAAGTTLQGEQLKLAGEEFAVGTARSGEQMKLAGEQLASQVRLSLGEQGLQAEQIKASLNQLRAGLSESMANIINASAFQGLNFKMQGRLAAAEFVQNNPQSLFSIFSGLAAIMQIAAAPGGRNLPPIQF